MRQKLFTEIFNLYNDKKFYGGILIMMKSIKKKAAMAMIIGTLSTAGSAFAFTMPRFNNMHKDTERIEQRKIEHLKKQLQPRAEKKGVILYLTSGMLQRL